MINAEHDEIIPRAATDSLWHAMGEPKIIWLNSGHISAAFFLPQMIQTTVQQFGGDWRR